MNNHRSDIVDPPVDPRSHPMRRPNDGRSAEARQHKRLLDSILFHLNDDRPQHQQRPPTEAEIALAERATALLMRLDVFNEKIIAGEPYDIPEHLHLHKAMLAALHALGITPLKPKPKSRGYY